MFYKGGGGLYRAKLDGSNSKRISTSLKYTPSLALNLHQRKICAAAACIPNIFYNLSKSF